MNERLLKKNDLTKAKKVKQKFRAVGGCILALGLAGIIACMVSFVIFFLNSDTETAFLAWMIAIPFIVIFVCGSVLARVGDQLLKNELAKEKEKKKKLEEED